MTYPRIATIAAPPSTTLFHIAPGDKWNDDTIKDITIDYIIERGTKKGQIHAHALVKFTHFTKLQLNYKKMKEKVQNELGLKNIYLNNRLIRNSGSENIVEYLNKYV